MANIAVDEPKNGLLLPAIICISACFFYLYEFILQVSPNVMTFHLMKDINIDAAQLGIMSGSYYIAYTFMQIPAGILYDRAGPRLLLTLATLVCAIGAFAFGAATDLFTMAAGRIFMGAASAFAFIGCLVLVARWFPPHYFAVLAGVVQFMSSVGALIGEIPLAAAVAEYGWRSTIDTLGFIGIGGAMLIWLVVRDSPKALPTQLDHPHYSNVLKQLWEVCKHSQSWVIFFFSFASWAPIIVFGALWGVPFLATRYGVTDTHASAAVSMVWLAIGIGSPLVGWWSDKIGQRKLPLTACMLIGLISFSMILFMPDLPYWTMFPLLFLFGFSASAQTLSFAVVKDNIKPSVVGTAVGFNNMAVVCGGILFQPLVGFLLRAGWDGTMVDGSPIYSIEDYRISLLIIPVIFIFGMILSMWFLKETYCRPLYDAYDNKIH